VKKLLAICTGLSLIAFAAISQTIPIPTVTSVSPTDLFADVAGGTPTGATKYATAAAVTNVPGYQYITPSATAWTVTQSNGTSDIIVNPAAGAYTGAVTTAANPGDGAILGVVNVANGMGQLTVTANTGQTVATQPPSTLAVFIAVRYRYVASTATWYRVL